MPQFRCTRPDAYGPGCPGHTDPSARNGHYITAADPEEAREKMKSRFPEDSRFDVEPWGNVREDSTSKFNQWFLNLPEGRQAVLREDKWMLANAAYEAGRPTKSTPMTGEQASKRFCRCDPCHSCVESSTCSLNCPHCNQRIWFQGSYHDMPLECECPYCQAPLVRAYEFIKGWRS